MPNENIKVLGELESEIMEIVWKQEQSSVRAVLLELEKVRKIAYTTVMTVMSRLHDKGVLKRKMDKSGAFVYVAVKDKKSFLANASEKIIKNFLKEYGDVAVAQFVDIIETSNTNQSEIWKNKLRELLK
ncbi:MAG: Penicillinase repressor [Candidatus Magasanikbacteria bacterium GW2011_GWC2_37_14]|uniref:Penicillinase repressor n=1 Tax=Candidatus Magasanikbacteria bacterium GW2011_GWC2_37_14 TaxID=1619046 RepID=A0A0G0ISV7_9BACT|nr:MAG: Penicillinase repressor [Candidatus Magasanikbacteria bacterium GW2011_GWC2_37_14]